MTYDLFIIFNNFLHDLAAAMWFCGTLALLFIVREGGRQKGQGCNDFVTALFARIKKITNASLAVVLLGGGVRALHYRQYEWQPALGREQVTLLIIKHILLAFIVVAGIWLQIRLVNKVKDMPRESLE